MIRLIDPGHGLDKIVHHPKSYKFLFTPMKMFTICKIGYSAGLYGCSAEYFTCIFTHDNALKSFQFYGLYGAEERVAGALKDNGYTDYTEFSSNAQFGKVPARETQKYSHPSYQIITNIKQLLRDGYLQFA